jgi:hypothetical protein
MRQTTLNVAVPLCPAATETAPTAAFAEQLLASPEIATEWLPGATVNSVAPLVLTRAVCTESIVMT